MTNIVNPTWAGPSLFVPIFPEALLIGQGNLATAWAATGYNYAALPLLGNLAPAPFATLPSGTAPGGGFGVNLTWTLPAALRSGTQQGSSGVVNFPPAPNRWLITRIKESTSGSPPVVTAWVLQSDFVGANGANPYPDPNGTGGIVNIGLVVPLGSWSGASGPQPAFLTAVAPANLSYAAVYANIGSVFGFYDPLTDADMGTYAYSVLGWYATPSDDPLFGKTQDTPNGFTTQAQWEGILKGLGWTTTTDVTTAETAWTNWLAANPITGGPSATPAQLQDASQVLCHAMIYGIVWKGTQQTYLTYGGQTGPDAPAVAIGSNGGEAIAVWLANTVTDSDPGHMIENLLLALRNNLALEYIDDPARYETATHMQRFGNSNAGKVWVVQRTTDAQNDPAKSYGGNTTVPLDANATKLLTDLNAAQAALDELNATIDSQCLELFGALWKRRYGIAQPQKIKTQINNYVTLLSDPKTGLIPVNRAAAQTAQTNIDGLKSKLIQALVPPPPPPGGNGTPPAPPTFTVSSIDQPRYYAAADPVVLVAGVGLDTKLASPGTFQGEDALPGRFTGQTISALTIAIAGVGNPVTLLATDVLPPLGLPSNSVVPKEVPDFWLETLLLDTGNATWLAYLALAKAGITNPSQSQVQAVATDIAKQQTLPFAGSNLAVVPSQALAAVAGLTGVPPDPISVDPWTPPWTPIFMDWQVAWSPTVLSPDNQNPPGNPSYLTGMLNGWQLDEVDYTWNGTTVPAPLDFFTGRTTLTPNQAAAFASQLSNFLSIPSNLAQLPQFEVTALQNARAQLSNLDVLTQSLSGLNDQMLMRLSAGTQINAASPLLQNVPGYVPAVGNTPNFYPIRSGHFVIQKLWIVDAFGQILRVIDTQGGIRNIEPLIAQSVTTPGTGNEAYVQVLPRITQSARLDARLLEADNDAIPSNSSDATSPICGWVMPNHLDDSLTVFDSAGVNLGALITVQNDQGDAVRWDAAPGADVPLGSPPQIVNAHLAGFVNGILSIQGPGQAAALAALLDVIDLTLWKTDPLGQPNGGNLAVLVGRPLAVVRIGVALEVDGWPSAAQNWADTGANNTRAFQTVPFPIRVGDFGLDHNGVTGYFLNDDYGQFYAANGHNPSLGLARRALKSGASAFRANLSALMSGTAVAGAAVAANGNYVVDGFTFTLPPDGTTTSYLTAFVDPRGQIPVVSGIQPVITLALAPGPVASALNAMFVTFRTGPVLTDADQISMPLPSAVTGDWSWIERSGVAVWREDGKITPPGQTASLPATPPSLREGWLKLSGAFGTTAKGLAANRRR